MDRISNTFKKSKEIKLILLLHIAYHLILHKENFKRKLLFFNILEIISMLTQKYSFKRILHQTMDIAMLKNG
jgi:hypothetical protein